jgi:glycosyltransferase involved in cell wall biosynthesis
MRSTVTVIIPTYNRAALLPQAINSLLAQTRKPDEIIVVDDGSTDDTRDILASYGASITTIFQPNRGLPGARNTGLSAAHGDFLVFLDSDDLLAPHGIERFAQVLEADPGVTVAYSDSQLIDIEGHNLGLFSQYHPVPRPSGLILAELALHNLFPPCAAMVRRIDLGTVIFDESLKSGLEDFDFWLRLAGSHQFTYINEPLVCYRVHTAMMSSKAHLMAESEVFVQQRVFDMPQFKHLTERQRARIYCSHGTKRAMLGQLSGARHYFSQAIRTEPLYPTGYILMVFSLLGLTGFSTLIKLRRKIAGNRIAGGGLQEIIKSPRS